MLFNALEPLSLPLLFTAGALALLAGPWLVLRPRLAVAFLLFSLVLGQTVRFPLPGQGGGLLISDLAVVIVLFAAVFWSFSHWDLTGHLSLVIGIFLASFILWSLFTLIIHIPELGLHNTTIAFSYWLRLTNHLLLLPALLILFQDTRLATTARRGLIFATTILVLLGFLQLWLVPDFTVLTKLGWDPHQNRLTSTWLDPNFFGAFLALTLPFVVANLASACHSTPCSLILGRSSGGLRGSRPPRPTCGGDQAEVTSQSAHRTYRAALALLALLLIIIIIALLLTQSRGALVALALSVLIFSPLITARTLRRVTPDRIMAIISIILLILTTITISAIFLHDRLIGLATLDATAQLRLVALKETWRLVEQNVWLGVGYNAYQFAAARAGLIANFTTHSRAGADNSWLTLWVTTGLPGVLLFLVPWAVAGLVLLKKWLAGSPYSLAALISLGVLFIDSQFINSFLYSHLLISLITVIALALAKGYRLKTND